jgi:CheY-like chemotaxis protein
MADVLYIEDNVNDADIFCRLMQKIDRSVSYTIIASGSEAVDYLTSQGAYQNQVAPLPKLILLDLNLLGVSGFDVIQKAREIDRTRFLPIIAFSTSDNPKDVKTAYEAGINAYVVKPGSYHAMGSLLTQLFAFWLDYNTRIDSK